MMRLGFFLLLRCRYCWIVRCSMCCSWNFISILCFVLLFFYCLACLIIIVWVCVLFEIGIKYDGKKLLWEWNENEKGKSVSNRMFNAQQVQRKPRLICFPWPRWMSIVDWIFLYYGLFNVSCFFFLLFISIKWKEKNKNKWKTKTIMIIKFFSFSSACQSVHALSHWVIGLCSHSVWSLKFSNDIKSAQFILEILEMVFLLAPGRANLTKPV